MRRHGVCYLHRGLAIEFRVVGKHPSEHGDVRSSIDALKQIGRLVFSDVFARVNSVKGLVGKREGSRSLFGRNKGELLDEGVFHRPSRS